MVYPLDREEPALLQAIGLLRELGAEEQGRH
jgi:hypothetical protein